MPSRGLSDYKVKKIIQCFILDLDATQTSKLLEINRNTINRYYNKIRLQIFLSLTKKDQFSGEVECDESYFGGKRIRGKRGRGASKKTPVFGLLKRKGKVYVEVVENCSKASLMPIIKGMVLEGSTMHTDGWKSYDGLVLNGYDLSLIHI